MIDPVALIVLADDATVLTPNGQRETQRLAIHEFGRVGERTVRVHTDEGSVYVDRPDSKYIVDLTTDAYEPQELETQSTVAN